MRTRHVTDFSDPTVKRGKATFGSGAGHYRNESKRSDRNESKRNENRANHAGAIGALRPTDKFHSGVPVPDDIFV
jgi:hypothetical protein